MSAYIYAWGKIAVREHMIKAFKQMLRKINKKQAGGMPACFLNEWDNSRVFTG